LIEQFGAFLWTSPQHFGFRKKVGCTQAIYALRKTVEYYNDRGSNVNFCAIDLAKAFEKLDRFALFQALMSRGCHAKFIAILINWFSNTTTVVKWFSNTTTVVKWGDALSSPVRFSTAVRQGNVLSPLLFGVFVNELLSSLSESGQGCHIKFTPFNVFMFAVDLLIVFPSIMSLQMLVDKCITKLKALDMIVNASKSSCTLHTNWPWLLSSCWKSDN